MRHKNEVPPSSITVCAQGVYSVFGMLRYLCGRGDSVVHHQMNNITLTDAAKSQMKSICDKQNETTVRYWLDGGGCGGLLSKWGFTEPEKGDTSWDLGEGCQFVIDKLTITYMDGATIDYGGDFMPAFKIGIPNRQSCGCGESFVGY